MNLKNNKTALMFLFLLPIAIISCEGNEGGGPETGKDVPTFSTTAFTATVAGTIEGVSIEDLNKGQRGILYTEDTEGAQSLFNSWQQGNNSSGCKQYGKARTSSNGLIETTVTGLKPETTYAFCLYYQSVSGKKRIIGSMGKLTTQKFNFRIETGKPDKVRFFDATVTGNVTADAKDIELCKYGIIFSTDAYALSYEKQHSEATAAGDDGSFSIKLNNLENATGYYYRAYIMVEHTEELFYGTVESFETRNTEEMAVDLGLSVKWASCNLGAQEPQETGRYYKWGDTEPSTNGERTEYKWWDNNSQTFKDIGENICGTRYDAAHIMLKGHWRMPTKEEIEELTSKCSMSMHLLEDYYVIELSNNGTSISLPVAGAYGIGGKGGNYEPSHTTMKITLILPSGTRSELNNEGEISQLKHEKYWTWRVEVNSILNEVIVNQSTGQKNIGIEQFNAEFAVPIRPVWDPELGN